MTRKILLALALAFTAGSAQSANSPTTKAVYENDFEKADVGNAPADFLVLDGAFAVKQDGTNKVLELPGAPLDSFGVLFGPSLESDFIVEAKIRGTRKGRRFPTFAVGCNGAGGYRLQVSPAKKLLELYKGDEVVTSVPFETTLDSWMLLRLENHKENDGAWKISGKAWSEKSPEPKQPLIVFEEKTKPAAGRASIWGSPFSGTPIQFDDLKISSREN